MKSSGIIKCNPGKTPDIRFQDGGLRHAVGTKNYQVIRATPTREEHSTDGYGWTYNHAAMLAWWRGSYYLEYLSNPISEHVAPGHSLLSVSKDGVHWLPPRVVFPAYSIPSAPYRGPKKELLATVSKTVTHHRMGFYVTKDDRLLVSSFYGFSPDGHIAPNNGWGVGRVVREIYADNSLSAVYFIRYNTAGGFDETNTPGIAFYKASPDKGFVTACDELLSNRLVTQQWWEEECNDTTGFFTMTGGKALSYYTAKDGAVIGVFKNSLVSESNDNGESWSPAVIEPTISTATGKVWGQRTNDGRYALAYNPTTDGAHRWPIAVVSGDDGRNFGDMLAITPEVSPGRYKGLLKNLGPQYIRGICEANPQAPGDYMHLCYSVNKEDIWVSKTPLPIRGSVTDDVNDSLDHEGALENWNLYVPAWCPVGIEGSPNEKKYLCLRDSDPYDRARAQRTFPISSELELKAEFSASPLSERDGLLIEIQNESGASAIKIIFGTDGRCRIKSSGVYKDAGCYNIGEWMQISINVDCSVSRANIELLQDNKLLFSEKVLFNNAAPFLERVLFATKPSLPFNTLEESGRFAEVGGLENADIPTKESVYRIASLSVINKSKSADE